MLKFRIKNISTELDGFIPNPEAFNDLYNELAYAIVGAEFSEKFLAGKWDGFKRLFNRKHKTFLTGLLNNAIEVLERYHIGYQIENLRVRPKITRKLKLKTEKKPRPYQLEAVQKFLIYTRGIIQAPTGAGKSFMIAMILAKLGLPSVVFVNTRDLLYQMKDDLKIIDIDESEIGQIGDEIIDPKLFTVATIQSVYGAFDLKYPKFDEEDVLIEKITDDKKSIVINTVQNASVIIIDEAQFLASDTFQVVANNSVNAYWRCCVSATPFRTDNADLMLNAATGKKIFSISLSELIDDGYLVAPDITMLQMPRQKQNLAGTSYASIYKSKVTDNEISNNLIVDITKFFYERDKTVLILVQQISHGEILANKLKTILDVETVEEIQTGPRTIRKIKNIEFLKGQVTSDKRKPIVALFRERKVKILIATTLADCGLDIPSLDVLILAGRGKSKTRVPQRIGRVIRTSPGKTRAYVFDFLDPAKYLNMHSRERYEVYASEPRLRIHNIKINDKTNLTRYLHDLMCQNITNKK